MRKGSENSDPAATVVLYPYISIIDTMEAKWETGILSTMLISQARTEQLPQLKLKFQIVLYPMAKGIV